ncbi:MAG: polysaccharide biosynthesis C-terminal domain-containing protein [Thaumarchaeota archaeon]|nr:polysaccharide biosynthesis C-terminal domain-containing protein [Nitrososphaerota archaeon]
MKDSWKAIKNISSNLKGLSTIGLANILGNVITGFFWLYMARLLGTEHYGEINYIIALAGLGVMFSNVGSSNTILVYVSKGVKIQSSIYFLSLIITAISSVILFILYHNVAISLYVIGNVISGLGTADMLAKKMYRTYFVYFMTNKILIVGLSLLFYYIMGYNGVVFGISLSFFPFVIIIYKGFKESKIDLLLLRDRFGFIINSYVLEITRYFSVIADKLIVAPLLGYALLGNYSLGLQFLSILGIIPGIVYQYILPHDSSGTPNRKLKQATILFSIIIAVLSILLSPIILPILFPKFTAAIGLIPIISVGVIPLSISNIYISQFLAREKSRIILIGSGIFLGVQIPTIFLLGKMFGINGVAASYVLSQASETAYLFLVYRHLYGIKPKNEDIEP